MKILAFNPLTALLMGTLLLLPHAVMASQGSVLERIHAADEPFDNMNVESAHQLTTKTVVAKESYQGG